MRHKLHLGLVCLPLVIAGVLAQPVNAETTKLQLRINGLECSLDTTFSQQQPNLSLQPEDCGQPSIVERIEAQQVPVPTEVRTTVAEDNTPGDQGFFEDTVFEPIAGWSGIGNSTASAMRPVIATGFLTATVVGMIDMLFLELRFTQAALTFSKRGFAVFARVVTRGF